MEEAKLRHVNYMDQNMQLKMIMEKRQYDFMNKGLTDYNRPHAKHISDKWRVFYKAGKPAHQGINKEGPEVVYGGTFR